jgi:hypothetical protein
MKDFKPSPAFQKKKWKEAVKFLNKIATTKIAPSPIHGVGIFALRNLKKGEVLEVDAIPHAFDIPYTMLGELRPEVREIVLSHWPAIATGSHFFYPVTRMVAYMNHSDDPNFDASTGKVLKAVKKGEEITEDYKLINGWERVFPWLDEKEVV